MVRGVDVTPVLPGALTGSTVLGAFCMCTVQIPLLSAFSSISQAVLIAFLVLCVITIMCNVYCLWADPGQIHPNVTGDVAEGGLPARAQKSWQYPHPVRRYDHYCKRLGFGSHRFVFLWVDNTIGLLNHREFVVMVGGLLVIAVLGMVVDIGLAILIAKKRLFISEIILVMHGAYSLTLLAVVWPIFQIHCGLIARNELAKEWKCHVHKVANNTTLWDNVPVEDLEDDEFNEHFDNDAFQYDETKNSFDKGFWMNCFTFWCQPRWPADARGDF
eukprot:Skav229065  [mRNA]  locus=scaffold2611:272860:275294:- [translate_table: standard]